MPTETPMGEGAGFTILHDPIDRESSLSFVDGHNPPVIIARTLENATDQQVEQFRWLVNSAAAFHGFKSPVPEVTI